MDIIYYLFEAAQHQNKLIVHKFTAAMWKKTFKMYLKLSTKLDQIIVLTSGCLCIVLQRYIYRKLAC